MKEREDRFIDFYLDAIKGGGKTFKNIDDQYTRDKVRGRIEEAISQGTSNEKSTNALIDYCAGLVARGAEKLENILPEIRDEVEQKAKEL